MPQAAEKMAVALGRLHEAQRDGRSVFRAAEFSRTTRDRLVTAGYLFIPIRGWLVASSPAEVHPGESTPWYTSFWEFCAAYANVRFGQDWHLSAEQSLLLWADNWTIPRQVIINSPSASNNSVELPFDTSVLDVRTVRRDETVSIEVAAGLKRGTDPQLRVLSPEVALIRVADSFFKRNPVEAMAVLLRLSDTTRLVRLLLEGGQAAVAGRIAGAFRHVSRDDTAETVRSAMQSAMHDVRESNPFSATQVGYPGPAIRTASTSALALRIQALWAGARAEIETVFPALPPERPRTAVARDPDPIVRALEERYAADAYHSLSIEGYQVTAGLIERVRTGKWDPESRDRGQRDALAAHGYWLAFQEVTASILKSLAGIPVAQVVREDHGTWFRQLFSPSVSAGTLSPGTLAGYRDGPVYIRSSRHVPARAAVVPDGMDALFHCIGAESHPGVAAVLAHWLFGYIHPYPDGNGRMARFLMNVLLVTGGYPWTVIRVDDRPEYMAALDRASVEQRPDRFAQLVVRCMNRA